MAVVTRAPPRLSPKLPQYLKDLINAPESYPGPAPAPARIRHVYRQIASEAHARKYGRMAWLTLAAAATATLNSPGSLAILHQVATTTSPPAAASRASFHARACRHRGHRFQPLPQHSPRAAAELIREVGLKCITLNGVPRTIVCLKGFHDYLAETYILPGSSPTSPLSSPLPTSQHPHRHSSRHLRLATTPTPSRFPTRENADLLAVRGRALWHSIYTPLDDKLEALLSRLHPDLPLHILGCHYGPLVSDPASGGAVESGMEVSEEQEEGEDDGGGGEMVVRREARSSTDSGYKDEGGRDPGLATLGRCLTSVVTIGCLRAQTGVVPQLLSHVYGLRKGVAQGMHVTDFGGGRWEREKVEVEGLERLAGARGCAWLLESVDRIAEVLGYNFAPRRGEWMGKKEPRD